MITNPYFLRASGERTDLDDGLAVVAKSKPAAIVHVHKGNIDNTDISLNKFISYCREHGVETMYTLFPIGLYDNNVEAGELLMSRDSNALEEIASICEGNRKIYEHQCLLSQRTGVSVEELLRSEDESGASGYRDKRLGQLLGYPTQNIEKHLKGRRVSKEAFESAVREAKEKLAASHQTSYRQGQYAVSEVTRNA